MMSALPQSEEEMEAIRSAVATQEGLLVSVFDVLRRVPRRVLMVLKLNDLTRSLDHALVTTHSNIRIFLVTAKFCVLSVWRNDQARLIDAMRGSGLMSFGLLLEYFRCWWRYENGYMKLVVIETLMDSQAYAFKLRDWLYGLRKQGFKGAYKAAAGLDV